MKIDNPQFKGALSEEVKVLEGLFVKNNFELRICGGAVRDILMGKDPKDLDFATTATPSEMKQMFTENEIRMINANGEKHGTITVRINDKQNYEVTTLRIDVKTDGRHAEVIFTKDWQADAYRRDLTINSMFLGFDGTLYDYTNGYEDLKVRKVTFVDDAEKRIREDYLRILRYFRFYGRIADKPDNHDEDTLIAIRNNLNGLENISGERIWVELQGIVTGNYNGELLELMVELGLGKYLEFPEKCNFEEFRIVNERLKENDSPLRVMSLLTSLFYSEEEFLMFHQRVKLSNAFRDLGLFLLKYRSEKFEDPPLRRYRGLEALSLNRKFTRDCICELFKYRGAFDLLKTYEESPIPRFPISAVQLTEVPDRRLLGKIMTELKVIWIEHDFKSTAEELLLQVPQILESLPKKNPKRKSLSP